MSTTLNAAEPPLPEPRLPVTDWLRSLPNDYATAVTGAIGNGAGTIVARTEAEIDALYDKLAAAQIDRCSPRASLAVYLFKEGIIDAWCVRYAISMERQARELWCEKSLDPFCKKHGLTRRQAISVVFDDHRYNAADPEHDLVTVQDLYCNSQGYDFSRALLAEMAEDK
jgi:hypothetical protein